MHIKRLDILGFKTFAEKTQVEMSQGMTAIVGPNGSGKSNISDALMWVLGESNVRNLRGQRATDVIFNGSEKRKALGMAEVSLTLDNSCGTLPLDYSEVTITRRAFRSGEGEYFINKTRCRLKDIYELFLDTGIGREAYSFVSQGEIDAVLSAKPEDRRELFEEAAGIKKYRYRREEALRKLERTETNLRRVCDIMSEIGGQLEPLAEQAEQARRFTELQSRLWDIEIGLLIRDLKKHTASLAEARASKNEASSRIEDYDRSLEQLEAEKDQLTAKLAKLEEEVESARRVQQSLAAKVLSLESSGALIGEKLKASDGTRARAEEDIAVLERRIEETRKRIADLESEGNAGVEAETSARVSVEAHGKAIQEMQSSLEQALHAVNSQKADYLEMAKSLATKRNALQNSKERIVQFEAAIAKHAQEIAEIEAQSVDAKAQSEQATAEIEAVKQRITALEAEVAKITADRLATQKEADAQRVKLAELSRDHAARSSRLGTLKEMAEAHEGFFEGVRNVMAATKAGKINGGYAVVADVLTVPEGYENAIETALGTGVQDIISDTVDQAKAAIAFLKENRAGRATFLPLDGIRPSPHRVEGGKAGADGFLGIAANLVKFDRRYSPAIESALGRVVVAENIDDAVYLSRKLDGWTKMVTLDGELILPSGAITGGTMKGKGPGLLMRKQEMDALGGQVKRIEREAGELQDALSRSETDYADLGAALRKSEQSLSGEKVSLAEQTRRADFAAREIERIGKQAKAVGLEKAEVERLLVTETESISRLEAELSTAGQENTDLDKKVSGAEEEAKELQTRIAAEREELMKLNMELASCVERNAAAANMLKGARSSIEELQESLRMRRSQIDLAADELAALDTERETVQNELRRQRELLVAAEKTLSELVSGRSQVAQETAEVDGRVRETGAARNRLATEAHDADVREARLEVQVTQITDRLLQEYELGYEQAMEWPEEEIEIERGAVSEVARLRREIKEMGPVNTGAVQEYERIKERWDFLTEQRTDLDSAKAQINEAIHEIDVNTRGLFMETFKTAAANFDAMFKRLFGGGATSLSLTDPNDLLQTGVDVTVQPPGKKMQDMALLSGGERALTASALLFALLLVKPSPFVVMDEVDAPLDESNVERFAEVLRHFAAKSQFIVITHNRATMEASDGLYGVTMQEPGVSKLISVKLSAEGPVEREIAAVAP